MDVNGDGLTDLVGLWQSGASANAAVLLSNGTDFGSGPTPWVSNDSVGGWGAYGVDHIWIPTDVNGDGLTDLVGLWQNGASANAAVLLSNGTSFGSPVTNNTVGGWGTLGKDHLWVPMDVNGDGLTDLVGLWENGANANAAVLISDGSGFGTGSAPWVSNNTVGGWGVPGALPPFVQ
jgi:hypothetical protein